MNYARYLFLGVFLTFLSAWLGLMFIPNAQLRGLAPVRREDSPNVNPRSYSDIELVGRAREPGAGRVWFRRGRWVSPPTPRVFPGTNKIWLPAGTSQRMVAERIRKLSQIIVQQQGKAVANAGESGIVGGRGIGHGQVVHQTSGLQQGFCQVRIVKCADRQPAFHHRGHRRKSLRPPAGANHLPQPPAAGASVRVLVAGRRDFSRFHQFECGMAGGADFGCFHEFEVGMTGGGNFPGFHNLHHILL